jgi:hypothetical protein
MLCAVRKLNTIVLSSGEMACMQSKNARNRRKPRFKTDPPDRSRLYIFNTPCLIQCLPKNLNFS